MRLTLTHPAAPCRFCTTHPRKCRGLCMKCYFWAINHGCLEEVALPAWGRGAVAAAERDPSAEERAEIERRKVDARAARMRGQEYVDAAA